MITDYHLDDENFGSWMHGMVKGAEEAGAIRIIPVVDDIFSDIEVSWPGQPQKNHLAGWSFCLKHHISP